MNIANTFPVYEPDQVLTNKHLNDSFNYLDQQDRLTRCKLIGSGIVCGLDISYSPESIHVSKGLALTSQGYMILLCDNYYSHYMPYSNPTVPKDLKFISQCDTAETGNIPFYKPGFEDQLLQLITAKAFNNLNAEERLTATALSSVTIEEMDKYVVVLFLEAEEVALKNCDTNDCNDKGSKIDFDVKVLLVKKTTLDDIRKVGQADTQDNSDDPAKYIHLKRYNVPVANINSSSGVLKAFVDLVDDALLKRIETVLSECYAKNKHLFQNELQDPFVNLYQKLRQSREKIIATNPILIQYFYDFIDDLIKSYNEFLQKLGNITIECCGNEMRFPLHVMLGEANANTNAGNDDSYRQYFIYSPLFDPQSDRQHTIRSLFTRMKLIIEDFSTVDIDDFEKRPLKITPSRYGRAALSKRCIPYYYNVAETGKELYRFWDHSKTRKGKAKANLSYNASKYSAAEHIINPLLYDIEPYDFFRIEGHIGKGIDDALIKVKQAQQKYNLPFDTVALSADYIGALVKGEEPKCLIQDLESDYRVLIAEFVCSLHDALCLASKVKYTGKSSVFPGVISTPIRNATLAAGIKLMTTNTPGTGGAAQPSGVGIASTFSPAVAVATPASTSAAVIAPAATAPAAFTATTATLADDEDEDKLVISAINILPDAADHIFVSTLVNEYQASKKYQKGDTLSRLCNPAAGLTGNKYISIVKANNGTFRNPVTVSALGPVSALSHEIFEFIDRAESVFNILMSTELADLLISDFKNAFKRFEAEVAKLKIISPRIAAEVEMTFDSCIVERLEALKNEYERRTAQYKLAKNFNYYFKKHGGIEHKAGVCKGGTFVLVYHEERRQRFVNVKSLFVNKDLSTLMMAHFQPLLKPDVEVNELEYQSNLLQTAILYKEPELYLRFKDVMKKYVDECEDLPEARRIEINAIISKPPELPRFELTNEMVIADFYVPYLCCSDCPPVTYILPAEKPDETANPTIKIDKNSFCSNDEARFPVTVTPKGGIVSGSGISVQPDGSFVFVPSNAGAGLHTLTYTLGSKNAAVQVTVIATANAKFSFRTTIQEELMKVSFINESTDATTYKWLLDNEQFSEKKDPEPISFKVSSLPHTILLRAANESCPTEFSIIIPRELGNVKIAVCSDKAQVNLKAEFPVGSEITNGAGIMNGFIVKPASLQLAETKSFTVTYKNDGTEAQAEIRIIVANAGFTMLLKRVDGGTVTVAVPALVLTLNLKALGSELSLSQWIVEQDGVPKLVKEGLELLVPLSANGFNPQKKIKITHKVSATEGETICTPAAAKFSLTRVIVTNRFPTNEPFDNKFVLPAQ